MSDFFSEGSRRCFASFSGMRRLIFATLFQCVVSTFELDWKKPPDLAKARLELNRLKEVKAFVTEDIPLYHNLLMKHIPGADPELVLLNHYYHELDRIPLSDMTRSDINDLLTSLGFYKKQHPEDQVPEEFRFAPAKSSPFNWHRSSPEDHLSDTQPQHTDL